MKFLVTGGAGFIGFHLCRRLLAEGHEVTAYDGVTPYYDVGLKRLRLAQLKAPSFRLVEGMLEDSDRLGRAVEATAADVVIHLAAQAGVRYSLESPQSYVSANLVGTANLLEALRHTRPAHFLFASTSSVYGGNTATASAETDRADSPLSLYAASKKAGEALTHSYAHLWSIPTTCLRFFTVYGPWGRPDMALFKFVSAIERGEDIEIFGEGRMRRDFTYVDDAIEAVLRLTGIVPRQGHPVSERDSLSPAAPWRAVNLGHGHPVGVLDLVASVERALGKTARTTLLPMQPGDPAETRAATALIEALIGDFPETPLDRGVAAFVDWYRSTYAGRAETVL